LSIASLSQNLAVKALKARSCLSEVGEFKAEVGEFALEVVEISPEVVAKNR